MPKITGFHHIALTVLDADESEDFYTRAFKFVRVLEIPDQEGRGFKRVFAHPSGMILGFSVHATNDGAAFSEFRTGLDHSRSRWNRETRWTSGPSTSKASGSSTARSGTPAWDI